MLKCVTLCGFSYLKATLLPHHEGNAVLYTKECSSVNNPKFHEEFRLAIAENKLISRTIQVHVLYTTSPSEHVCVVNTFFYLY